MWECVNVLMCEPKVGDLVEPMCEPKVVDLVEPMGVNPPPPVCAQSHARSATGTPLPFCKGESCHAQKASRLDTLLRPAGTSPNLGEEGRGRLGTHSSALRAPPLT